jgi:hypothetical protein
VRDPINENGVGSLIINPKQEGREPQQHSPNDKLRCKYKDIY